MPMSPQEFATELIRIREESRHLEARETELRSQLEGLLSELPENRLSVAGHDFMLIPAGSSEHLSKQLLRQALRSRGSTESEIDAIMTSATKTTPRAVYLRITGK